MAPLTNGWYQDKEDPRIIVNDKLPPLRKSDQTGIYRLKIKADPLTGAFDYYNKGAGAFGGDQLMFRFNASGADGTLTEYNGFVYGDFFKGEKKLYNTGLVEKTKGQIYQQATAEQKSKLDLKATYAGYKQLAAAPPEPPAGNAEPPADPAGNREPATPNSALEDLSKNFENKPFKNQNWLRYPENINSNQDRIIISQINFVAASLEPENVFAGSLQNREGQFAKQESLGQVILPIPNELSEANSTGWGDDSLSTIAAALMKGGAASFEDFAEGKIFTAAGGLGETLTAATNNPAVGNRVKQFLATKAAAGLLNKGGITINPEAFITRATGSAINPNLELLFQGPKLRQFGFSFKMAPRSEEEARNIRYIIKFFKKGMSPKRSTQSEFSVFLGTPNVFKIQFKSSESSADLRSIGQIKTCALINFTVNYTPDGLYAAYKDFAAGGSQPVAVTMNLAFSELTPIFNDNYEDTDSVGPDNFDDIAFTPPSPAPTDTPTDSPTDSPLGQNNNRLPVGTLPPAN